MSLKQHKKADKIKWIIAFSLIAILLLGSAFTIYKLVGNETTADVSPLAYEVGALDEQGKEIRNTGFIRMRNAISVAGLEIKVKEDPQVEYQVFFYSEAEDGELTFIEATELLSVDLVASEIPAGADVCKIVIQPVGDAEVGIFEVVTYANQLAVTYNK